VRRLALLLSALLVFAACGGDDESAPPAPAQTAAGFEFAAEGTDVAAGEPIDSRYTCDGDDVSPALAWQGTPDGTQELALVVDDPDAPGGTFLHWLAWAIPADATSLPEGVPNEGEVMGPTPLRQGQGDSGDVGWSGPCPPVGETHGYVFRLMALDADLDLDPGAELGAFDEATSGHVIAEARLEATYARTD
jgi:Raf kinase inhibitor-like YbhB/YbcL family protein